MPSGEGAGVEHGKVASRDRDFHKGYEHRGVRTTATCHRDNTPSMMLSDFSPTGVASGLALAVSPSV